MAHEESRHNDAPASRVYKAKQVHKRRVSGNASARIKQAEAELRTDGPDAEEAQLSLSGELSDEADAPDGHEGTAAGKKPAPSPQLAADEDRPAGEDAEESEGSDETQDAEDAEWEDGPLDDEGDRPRRKRRKPRLRTVVLVVLALIVVAAVACASLFAWNRWGRYDDFADMQGEWFVQGTAVPVVIDETTIHLSDDLAYSYAINDRDKTITYSFGDWEGQGRYRFGEDRSTLAITDGQGFTGTGNALDDLRDQLEKLKSPDEASQAAQDQAEEGTVLLSRTADPVALAQREARELAAQQEAEQLAQEGGEEDDYYYE